MHIIYVWPMKHFRYIQSCDHVDCGFHWNVWCIRLMLPLCAFIVLSWQSTCFWSWFMTVFPTMLTPSQLSLLAVEFFVLVTVRIGDLDQVLQSFFCCCLNRETCYPLHNSLHFFVLHVICRPLHWKLHEFVVLCHAFLLLGFFLFVYIE